MPNDFEYLPSVSLDPRAMLRALGLTQKALACFLGIAEGHLSRVLSGKVRCSAEVRAEMCRFFLVQLSLAHSNNRGGRR